MDRAQDEHSLLKRLTKALHTTANGLPYANYGLISVLFVFAITIVASLIFQEGSFLHIESRHFLQNYLDQRNIFQKIFDPGKNDWGNYQARELSYAMDWLDAQIIGWSYKLGYPLFYQWSHFCGLFLIATTQLVCCSLYFKNTRPIPQVLLTLLFLTSPISFLSGNYFRSSKILVAVFLHFLIWMILFDLRRDPPKPAHENYFNPRGLGVLKNPYFLLSSALALADRQGFYFLCGLTLILCFHSFSFQENRSIRIVRIFGISIAWNFFYNIILGRVIPYWLHGYWVKLGFQEVHWEVLFTDPEVFLDVIPLFFDHFRYFFGNLPFLPGWIPFLVFGVLFWTQKQQNKAHFKTSSLRFCLQKNFSTVLFTISTGLILFLYLTMRTRHGGLAMPDIRRIYYWIPTNMLIFTAGTFALHQLSRKISHTSWITGGLLLLLVTNIQALPASRDSVWNGDVKKEVAEAPRLRACLLNPQIPTKDFHLSPETEGTCAFFRSR